MKSYMLLIFILTLVSCNQTEKDIINADKQFLQQGGLETVTSVYDFKFREHDYLQFGYNQSSTIVHNPDCLKCCKK